jgi:ferric-dicitrate binding protein FerR (iron transport regulator)
MSSDEDAVVWFAKLRRGVMTLEERTGYEAWRRETRNAVAMAELERVWQSMDVLQDRFAPQTLPARRMGLPRPALLAAMCVISLGIGIVSYSGNNSFWTKLDWVER